MTNARRRTVSSRVLTTLGAVALTACTEQGAPWGPPGAASGSALSSGPNSSSVTGAPAPGTGSGISSASGSTGAGSASGALAGDASSQLSTEGGAAIVPFDPL